MKRKIFAICVMSVITFSILGMSKESINSYASESTSQTDNKSQKEKNEKKEETAGGKLGKTGKWRYEDGVLTLEGSKKVHITSSNKLWAKYNSDIRKIVIGDGVESVMFASFEECTEVTTIYFGKDVDDILGVWNINNCLRKLNTISVSPDNKRFFSSDSVLFSKHNDEFTLQVYPADKKSTEYTVPDGTKSVCGKAFKNAKNLKKLTFCEGIKSVGGYVCAGCENLTNVILPDSLKIIPSAGFKNCKKLKTVTLGKKVKLIRYCAFENCKSLKKVNIPDSVESIERNAYKGCSNVSGMYIGKSVKSIASSAFNNVGNLKNIKISSKNKYFAVSGSCLMDKGKTVLIKCIGKGKETFKVPEKIKTIKHDAFSGCSDITKIYIPSSVTKIEGYDVYGNEGNAFSKCESLKKIVVSKNNKKFSTKGGALCSKSGKTLIAYPVGLKGKRKLPEEITTLKAGALWGCKNITELILPHTLKKIGIVAFSDCTSIKKIVIPENVETIQGTIFEGCNNLREIYLSGIFSIYSEAFYTGNEKKIKLDIYYPKTGDWKYKLPGENGWFMEDYETKYNWKGYEVNDYE